MKINLKATFLVPLIFGIMAVCLLVSFTTYSACDFANQHTEFIKKQTRLALGSKNLEKGKYHAYKALNGIHKTKGNFKECGCEHALHNINQAEKSLKNATKASSFEDLNDFLKIALKSTLLSIAALENFDSGEASDYSDDLLVMNTKQVLHEQGGVLLSKREQLQETIDHSLSKFKGSLDQIVHHVECGDAFNFISDIHAKTSIKLKDKALTEAKRYYHTQVKQITFDALTSLGDCTGK
ncbi:hypothetical protein MTsPCn5_26980 [Croceitalea sp. MTPC5]|uniref:hypothetical protein n=1 Tax=Croceitalea sp. MTPC5 TaxID=3056565 RepID=UPI002B3B5176|nr:hypothetical protein MTsPCn5_26980 [Croceitalea sp. MTPC5]